MISDMPNYLLQPLYNTQEFNIAVLGPKKVGKTQFCLALSLQHNKNFKRTEIETKGIEQFSFCIRNDETLIKINLWDYKAKDEYRNTHINHIKNMHGVFIMYDLTEGDSISHLLKYFRLFKANCSEKSVCIVLGTKSDMSEQRVVSHEEIDRFTLLRRVDSLEISSLKKINISEALANITYHLLINFDNINTDISGRKFDHSYRLSEVGTISFKGNEEDDISRFHVEKEKENKMNDYSMTDDSQNERSYVELGRADRNGECKICCRESCQIF